MRNPYPNTHKSNFVKGDLFVQAVTHEFSSEERVRLKELMDSNASQGETWDSAEANKAPIDRRRSQVHLLNPGDYPWVCEKIFSALRVINLKYNFDISSIGELQLARYDEDDSGFYDWHMDIGPGAFFFRKISVSILLNSPQEFSGGDIEFNTGGSILRGERSEERLLAFPSFLLHRVTPVTRGRRYVLIAWVHGGDWR